MSSLQGKSIFNTYKDLLQVSNNNVGVDDTARYIEDGEGTPSVLSISTSNVGIGTTNPVRKFEVVGDSGLAIAEFKSDSHQADSFLYITNTATPVATEVGSSTTLSLSLHNQTGGKISAISTGDYTSNGNSNCALAFSTALGNLAEERMRISSAGNVGIGTTTPSTKLELLTNTTWGTPGAGSLKISNHASGGDTSLEHVLGDIEWITQRNAENSQAAMIRVTRDKPTSGNGSSMRFFMNIGGSSTSTTERMRVASDGNVGIGTTNPVSKLHTASDDPGTSITSANARCITIQDTSLTDDALSLINFTTSNGYGSSQIGSRAVTNISGPGVRSDIFVATRNSDDTFTEKLIIKSNGNVGIGTTAPTARLHVQGPNDTTFVNGRATMSIAGDDLYDADGAGAGINFSGRYLANGEFTTFATIHTENENPNGSRYDCSLVFGTRRTGTGSASDLERMRITSLGELALHTKNPWYVYNQTTGEGAMSYLPVSYGQREDWGATNTTGGSLMISNDSAHGWANIYVNRFGYSSGLDARFIDFLINGAGMGGNISANSSGNGVNYNTGSDRRLKSDIVDMTDGKDVVMQLKPRRFIWKSNHVEGDGFIADELSQVIPHAVSGEPDATNDDGTPKYQGVDYSKMVPVLTSALQQALQEIEQLKTRIETLENK